MERFIWTIVTLIAVLLIAAIWISICEGAEIEDIVPYIIKAESGGNPNALGKNGEIGLMQISPIVLKEWNLFIATKRPDDISIYENGKFEFHYFDDVMDDSFIQYTKKDLYTPNLNKAIGTWYLNRLKDRYLKEELERIDKWVRLPQTVEPYVNWKKYGVKTREDIKLALILSAYNGGITKLRKNNYDISKMPRSVKWYVNKIMKWYKQGQKIGE